MGGVLGTPRPRALLPACMLCTSAAATPKFGHFCLLQELSSFPCPIAPGELALQANGCCKRAAGFCGCCGGPPKGAWQCETAATGTTLEFRGGNDKQCLALK